jgi:hypothetical protein
MTRRIAVRGGVLLALLLLLAAGPGLKAGTLTAESLSSLVQSAASDSDAVFLYLLAGGTPGGPAPITTYTATATDDTWASWTGMLVDTMATTVDLSYTGTLTGFPPGTVGWSTSGTLGADTLSGSGSATISYPTSSTFALSFSDNLSNNAGSSYSVSCSLNGSILGDGSFGFGASEYDESGPCPVDLNLIFLGNSWYSFWQPAPGNFYRDDIQYIPFGPNWPTSGWFNSPVSFEDVSTPEPNGVFLLATGLLGMGLAARRRIAGSIRRAGGTER